MKTNHNHIHNDTRIALLEQSIGHINQTLIRIESTMNKKFEAIDEKFSSLEADIKTGFIRLDTDIKSNYRWTVTTLIALFVLNGFMPAISHWLSKFLGA